MKIVEFIKSIISNKKKLGFAVLLIIIAAIPLTVWVALQQQEIRQRAEGEKTAFFFSKGTDCSNPISTATTFPKSSSITLTLCLNTNFTGTNKVSGVDVTVAKPSTITFNQITAGADGTKLTTDVETQVKADGSLRFWRVESTNNTFGGVLNLAKITATTGSSGDGTVTITKGNVISIDSDVEVTSAKPPFSYSLVEVATVTSIPAGDLTVNGQHFIDSNNNKVMDQGESTLNIAVQMHTNPGGNHFQSNTSGFYTYTSGNSGTFQVVATNPTGYKPTNSEPTNNFESRITVSVPGGKSGINFGWLPINSPTQPPATNTPTAVPPTAAPTSCSDNDQCPVNLPVCLDGVCKKPTGNYFTGRIFIDDGDGKTNMANYGNYRQDCSGPCDNGPGDEEGLSFGNDPIVQRNQGINVGTSLKPSDQYGNFLFDDLVANQFYNVAYLDTTGTRFFTDYLLGYYERYAPVSYLPDGVHPHRVSIKTRDPDDYPHVVQGVYPKPLVDCTTGAESCTTCQGAPNTCSGQGTQVCQKTSLANGSTVCNQVTFNQSCNNAAPNCSLNTPVCNASKQCAAPTSTVTPTRAPTSTPTITPTQAPNATATTIPSVTPTLTTTPTPTVQPGNSAINLALGLDGIGVATDNAARAAGNTNTSGLTQSPTRTERTVTVELYTAGNTTPVITKTGIIAYNATTTKLFTGTIDLGQTTGTYTVKVKTPGYLKKNVGAFSFANNTVTAPRADMIAGDVNGDNRLDIQDYNILASCIFNNGSACGQNSDYIILSDLNDNGQRNVIDYSLFIRELSVQNGD